MIPGMKQVPYGLPLMEEAWIGCLHWTAGKPEIIADFHAATGIDLTNLVGRSPLEKMIDDASKHEMAVWAAFADWVAVNIWGIDE